MNRINSTKHCRDRMQQRSITGEVIEILVRFGTTTHHAGAEITFLDKHARKKAPKTWNIDNKVFEKASKAYLVEKDGKILTVAFKTKHFKRDA